VKRCACGEPDKLEDLNWRHASRLWEWESSVANALVRNRDEL
jgi:hypothetical protein